MVKENRCSLVESTSMRSFKFAPSPSSNLSGEMSVTMLADDLLLLKEVDQSVRWLRLPLALRPNAHFSAALNHSVNVACT